MRRTILWIVAAGLALRAVAEPLPEDFFRVPELSEGEIVAKGHDSRIDIQWHPEINPDLVGYRIYRADSEEGPFEPLHQLPLPFWIYSDFVGENGKTYWYRITKIVGEGRIQEKSEEGKRGDVFRFESMRESEPGEIVSATTREMTEEELLTSVQQATFRYFWDYAHPDSGVVPERYHPDSFNKNRRGGAVGGTGFGFMAILVGAERGFVSREQAAERTLKMLRFLQDKAERFHGAWPHWLNAETGKVIPFSKQDDGADLVETSYMIQGMLTSRQYFDRENEVETEIRRRADQLWREVEWDWFLMEPTGKFLYWHWSAKHGWAKKFWVVGYNECMITYLLAIASPTHAIPPECYTEGWAHRKQYANGKTFYGYKQWVGPDLGGPLFFTHYSFLGFDPRRKRDQFCNYFENNRNTVLIDRAYCIKNPGGFKDYGELVWGLTASYTAPKGYKAHAPGDKTDNGTLSPTAALGSMPYAPKEVIATLKHFYHVYGKGLWGPMGFRDAFNPTLDWFSDGYLAIDQGPILVMMENHRSELGWKYFMRNREIQPALQKIGWRRD